MSDLISLGIKQGCVIKIAPELRTKPTSFDVLKNLIQGGRYGLFSQKEVSLDYFYVVLTQDCSIASGKPIELAQLKIKGTADQPCSEHLLLGKDYNRLFLKFKDKLFEADESLLTKLKTKNVLEQFELNNLSIEGYLTDNDTRILLTWRTYAYFREPFPDKFNRALTDYLSGEGKWFDEFLKEQHDKIHSIRVYINPDFEGAESYNFALTALLLPEGEAEEEFISEQIDKMLLEFGKSDSVKCMQSEVFDFSGIELPEHLILSLTSKLSEFTFANGYLMREYNFQYTCFS